MQSPTRRRLSPPTVLPATLEDPVGHDPPECVFCEIIAGRSPASLIYDSPGVLGLVPLRPVTEGHALVIPKAHVERMHDVSAPTLQEIVSVLAGMARAMNLRDYNILQNTGPWASGGETLPGGETTRHVHFHLIPRRNGDGVRLNQDPGRVLSREELDCIARDIRSRLRRSGL